ncbi:MAG: hypothetical protein ACRENV_07520, partial [Candidatus Dormibacteria bacterium]
LGDLATACLPAGRFEVVVLAGNVMIFVASGKQAAVLANLAPAVSPGGVLVAGFQLGGDGRLADYDRWAAEAGLELSERWSTWDRQPWRATGDYAVSVHARQAPAVAPSANDVPTDQG